MSEENVDLFYSSYRLLRGGRICRSRLLQLISKEMMLHARSAILASIAFNTPGDPGKCFCAGDHQESLLKICETMPKNWGM